MTEIISITALAVSVIAALGSFVKETHIQKCKGFCFESDCRKNGSPINSAAPSIREQPLPTPPIHLRTHQPSLTETETETETHAYDHYKTFKQPLTKVEPNYQQVSNPIDINLA